MTALTVIGVLACLGFFVWLWRAGRRSGLEAGRAAVAKQVEKGARKAHEVDIELRSLSRDDVDERLSRWTRGDA